MPSLMRQSEPAPTRDENRDGHVDSRDEHVDGREDRVDGRDERSTGTATAADAARTRTGATDRTEERGDTTRTDDPAKHRAGSTVTEPDTAPRTAPPVTATAPAATRTETRRDTDRTSEPERGLGERTPDADRTPESEPVVVDRGPRPRASMLATLSLVFGVAAAAFVLSGALAGYGIVLGTIALLLGVSGVSATARRHVAGKTDALIGIVLGVGAVVVAVLAMTGQFDWPTTDGDTVVRFREWLDSQFVDRF
ncbi:thrombospondin [Plantactinospora sp. BC1]|nr:thrombospondin [Plantactinospora sp. BC1]